jgi:hypothetical protein
VATWVSELQRGASTVDIYARIFNAAGVPVGNEFPVNTVTTNLCANPSVAGSPDGGFAVAWSQKEVSSGNSQSSQFNTSTAVDFSLNGWDVYARTFDGAGAPKGFPFRLNTLTYGDQFAPKISAFGKNYLATWIGFGQDGSREGIYGQFFTVAGDLAGVEFQVNTANGSRQINPTVSSDGVNRFLVTWASYATSGNFDLFAREYDLIQVSIANTPQGVRISWNAKPGVSYQVQSSTDYTNWANFGAPRIATGLSDFVDVTGAVGFVAYRVVRIQ